MRNVLDILTGSDILLLLESVNSQKSVIKEKKKRTLKDSHKLVRLHEIEDLLIKRKLDLL